MSEASVESSCDTQTILDVCQTNGPLRSSETCFGLIYGASMKEYSTPEAPKNFKGDLKDDSLSLRVRVRGVTVVSNAIEIGILDNKFGELLKKLQSSFSVRLEPHFELDSEDIARKSQAQTIKAVTFKIYGSASDTMLIGDFLANYEVYLQEPDDLAVDVLYQNPHVFTKTDSLRTPLLQKHGQTLDEQYEEEIEAVLDSSRDVEEMVPFVQDFTIIKTELKSHQITAFRFMIEREAEFQRDERQSLWMRSTGLSGTRFQHRVTLSEKDTIPTQGRGGLLADDMGLGKSLSVLAVIAHTLTQAQAYKDLGYQGEAKHRTAATLIITPKTTIQSWQDQIIRHLNSETLNYMIYHGTITNTATAEFDDVDIVITTYDMVVSKMKSGSNDLRRCSWFRVVLDEGHIIRNSSTQTFQLLNMLDAQRRWVLTGTPVQNSLQDLFSLTKFLRFAPFDEQTIVNKHILRPLQQRDRKGLENLRLVMQAFCLRRTKKICQMVHKNEIKISINLSESERRAYGALRDQGKYRLSQASRRGSRETGSVLLHTIHCLRQFCSHGQTLDSASSDLSSETNRTCTHCSVVLSSTLTQEPKLHGRRGHVLCQDCYDDFTGPGGIPDVNSQSYYENHSERDILSSFQDSEMIDENDNPNTKEHLDLYPVSQSTKLLRLMRQLMENEISSFSVTQGPAKSLIFSSWKRTLDSVQLLLDRFQIPFLRIDGSCSLDQRQSIISRFQSDTKTRVLLLTLGTGSVGLNLTAASHIHILEPHWNPALEEQAASRAHRLDQTQPVSVYRYIVKDSIEERIQKMQRRKKWFAELSQDQASEMKMDWVLNEHQSII